MQLADDVIMQGSGFMAWTVGNQRNAIYDAYRYAIEAFERADDEQSDFANDKETDLWLNLLTWTMLAQELEEFEASYR